MSLPPETDCDKVVDLKAVFDTLSKLPRQTRIRKAKQLAADLLEYAAFEMAPDHSAIDVAEVIRIAAHLDPSPPPVSDSQPFDDARAVWNKSEL